MQMVNIHHLLGLLSGWNSHLYLICALGSLARWRAESVAADWTSLAKP